MLGWQEGASKTMRTPGNYLGVCVNGIEKAAIYGGEVFAVGIGDGSSNMDSLNIKLSICPDCDIF